MAVWTYAEAAPVAEAIAAAVGPHGFKADIVGSVAAHGDGRVVDPAPLRIAAGRRAGGVAGAPGRAGRPLRTARPDCIAPGGLAREPGVGGMVAAGGVAADVIAFLQEWADKLLVRL